MDYEAMWKQLKNQLEERAERQIDPRNKTTSGLLGHAANQWLGVMMQLEGSEAEDELVAVGRSLGLTEEEML